MRSGIREMEGKRQRGTDREEEIERRGTGEQTEGKRQRGEIYEERQSCHGSLVLPVPFWLSYIY
jgi:hypothetical protein